MPQEVMPQHKTSPLTEGTCRLNSIKISANYFSSLDTIAE